MVGVSCCRIHTIDTPCARRTGMGPDSRTLQQQLHMVTHTVWSLRGSNAPHYSPTAGQQEDRPNVAQGARQNLLPCHTVPGARLA